MSAFIDRMGRLPVRDWLVARDSVDGHGAELAAAVESAEAADAANGLGDEYRAAERRVARLVDGIEWFARESGGVHGITLRDIGAMRLLATWAVLAQLIGDRLEPTTSAVLSRPFAQFLTRVDTPS